ncbi:hypothetical protein JIY74_24500 [Vibrio harveyi]|nr:hypothetical protein [Vibrio harveyi]
MGRILASEFLLTYETHKEVKDFVSINLIEHENLSEDFSFNKINSLLEEAFDEMNNQNIDSLTVQEIIILLLKKSLTYQIENGDKK